ncbi:MAG TPA: transcription-repair coupling factor [Myxococcaceae bacterium]|nr:transcription-repair coupling factor [Myxococcaceae bacterium]
MADSFQQLSQALTSGARVRTVGLVGAARGLLLAHLVREQNRPVLCITEDDTSAEALAADLALFLGGPGSPESPHVLRLPADGVLPYDALTPDRAVVAERLGTLFHLQHGTSFSALVVPIRQAVRRMLPPRVLQELSRKVTVGEDVDPAELARQLERMGYQSAPLVEDPGTFSLRGGILDVFSPLLPHPVRLEFFGDTIDALRTFDPETQRTLSPIASLWLGPARETLLTSETLPLAEAAAREAAERINLPTTQLRAHLDSLREGMTGIGLMPLLPALFPEGLASLFELLTPWSAEPLIYLDDPVSLARELETFTTELHSSHASALERQELVRPPEEHALDVAAWESALAQHTVLEGGGLSVGGAGDAPPIHLPFSTTHELRDAIRAQKGDEGALQPLVDRLRDWRKEGILTLVACGTLSQADRLRRMLEERKVSSRIRKEPIEDLETLRDPAVAAHLVVAEASHGFVSQARHVAVLTDEEIFGVRAKTRPRRKSRAEAFAQTFRELKEGDVIVHTDFGIGRYRGLVKMEVRGIPGDFLLLEYAGGDKVYLPVARMGLVQKWSGGNPESVTLDRLGGVSWERTKKRVREQLLKMAAELLRLYAARTAHPGYAFSPPDHLFHAFEADFPYAETPDQARAIEDVLADMQKPTPMDRLICGDVGYGKTEVAMRAAFKAVLDGKQVAVLVPTTVLAHQHTLSFKKRFENTPVSIESLSRLHKGEAARQVLERLRKGTLDIVIGTHKLLGGELAFKDLGLIIVDEEQRFGVKQKEALKRFKTQVDVLTLSATPIPRTLNMAMSGVRDMSVITTPPRDRRAIRTFVQKYDGQTVREAILREVARGGQVFFVHNRVESIRAMEQELRELVPEVSLVVAHGQMPPGQLEKVMEDFVAQRYQVLLSTTIIESGIDIARANTMIVDRADTFGLAQLYQLRGRVGRSRERAYAYLMIPARRPVTPDAQRRLEVLQTFSELGSGFSIASHDLEIRGAGNLLGGEQSGAIEAIGFELYTDLLEEAVAELRGEPVQQHVEPEVQLPIAALIPEDYVPDVHQRLVFYKRFSQAPDEEALEELRAELVDRYGEVPDEVDGLCHQTSIKLALRDLRLRNLDTGAARLVITLGPDAALDPVALTRMVQNSGGIYKLTPDMKLVARVPADTRGDGFVTEARKVLADLRRCAV